LLCVFPICAHAPLVCESISVPLKGLSAVVPPKKRLFVFFVFERQKTQVLCFFWQKKQKKHPHYLQILQIFLLQLHHLKS